MLRLRRFDEDDEYYHQIGSKAACTGGKNMSACIRFSVSFYRSSYIERFYKVGTYQAIPARRLSYSGIRTV